MSRRRILPAALLAGAFGFLGLHRFYAGRYLTGFVQLLLFCAGAALLGQEFSGLLALRTLDQVQDWAQSHQVQACPLILTSIPIVWALVDTLLLLAGKFSDGQKCKITRWL